MGSPDRRDPALDELDHVLKEIGGLPCPKVHLLDPRELREVLALRRAKAEQEAAAAKASEAGGEDGDAEGAPSAEEAYAAQVRAQVQRVKLEPQTPPPRRQTPPATETSTLIGK